MDAFQKAVKKAEKSSFQLWLLNKALHWKIPFNKPHGVSITKITTDGFEVTIPYKSKNLNHIKGVHACALATASEYVAGLSLLRKLSSDKYRLIMERMDIRYKYQGKTSVTAKFELTDEQLKTMVLDPLRESDVIFVNFTSTIYDTKGQLISEADTRWQIKSWDKVKTKL